MTKEQIIQELNHRKDKAKFDLRNDFYTPTYKLGYYDALGELLEWVEENEK